MERITVYATQWCGACRSVKRFLMEKGLPFLELDIEQNAGAAERVMRWSGGRRVVPTLELHCSQTGSSRILHNPNLSELADVL